MKFYEMYPILSDILIFLLISSICVVVFLVALYIAILLIFNIIGSIKSFKSEAYKLNDEYYKE